MSKSWVNLACVVGLTAFAASGCGGGDQASPGHIGLPDDDGAGGAPANPSTGVGGSPVKPPPMICPEATGVYEVQAEPSNLLFVLDRSGSMHLSVNDNQTRWTLTTAGLGEILHSLASDTAAGPLKQNFRPAC